MPIESRIEAVAQDISEEETQPKPRKLSNQEVLQLVSSYFQESKEVREKRRQINERNLAAYRGDVLVEEEDSEESSVESSEHLPRTFIAVERITKFIMKALSDVGDKFFSIETRRVDIDPEDARGLLTAFLDKIGENGESFFELLEDAIKLGLLKGEMIGKVWGGQANVAEIVPGMLSTNRQDRPARTVMRPFRPYLSIIDPDSFYPDPTGRGLYEIHHLKVDLHELYEKGFKESAIEKIAKNTGGRQAVDILEVYGHFIGKDGKLRARDSFCVIAKEDDVVLQEVIPNPYWHSRSPFVVTPLTRCPLSAFGVGVAPFDSVVDINLAMDRLFNLMLDGALGAAKGVLEVRPSYLENPYAIADGLKAGDEIHVRGDVPFGAKTVSYLPLGAIPAEAFNMFALLDRALVEAGMLTDIAIGRPPPKEATATEIIQLTQSQSYLLNGLIMAVERFIREVLYRVWMLLMQNLEFVRSDDIVSAIGYDKAIQLSQMTPEERYSAFSGIGFRVTGLSEFVRKQQDLQALVSFVSAWMSNPVMVRAFMSRFDLYKVLLKWATLSGVDVGDLTLPEELQQQLEMAVAMPQPPQQQQQMG